MRIGAMLLIHNVQYGDSTWYDAAAVRLAFHGEYGPSGPSAVFPPGWPAFLAVVYRLFGHSQDAARVANALLGAATCTITYFLGRRLFGSRVAVLSALIVAFWPNLVFHTLILGSETLSTFLFVATLLVGTWEPETRRLQATRAVLLGVAMGWGMLVRPVAAILAPALALYVWLKSRSARDVLRSLAPAVGIGALFVLGWTARNYARFHELIPLATNGGSNFFQSNNRYADGDDTFWSKVPKDDSTYQRLRESDEFTQNREGYRLAIAYLREHPLHPLIMAPRKLWLLYHTDTSGLYQAVLYAPESAASALVAWIKRHEFLAKLLTAGYYAAIVLFAGLGAVMLVRSKRAETAMLVALPLFLWGFHLNFHAKDRFHVPLLPMFALLAAAAIQRRATIIKAS